MSLALPRIPLLTILPSLGDTQLPKPIHSEQCLQVFAHQLFPRDLEFCFLTAFYRKTFFNPGEHRESCTELKAGGDVCGFWAFRAVFDAVFDT